jgi:hypothetical protein
MLLPPCESIIIKKHKTINNKKEKCNPNSGRTIARLLAQYYQQNTNLAANKIRKRKKQIKQIAITFESKIDLNGILSHVEGRRGSKFNFLAKFSMNSLMFPKVQKPRG